MPIVNSTATMASTTVNSTTVIPLLGLVARAPSPVVMDRLTSTPPFLD